MTDISKFIEHDTELILTGRASSPCKRFEQLRCMVATVSLDNGSGEGDYLKVWPMDRNDDVVFDDYGQKDESGKFWFRVVDIEACEVVNAQAT